MKKMIVVAVLIAAGVAFASSLSVPWFVDSRTFTNVGFPPTSGGAGVQGIVYLHNNLSTTALCNVAYYSGQGYSLGPAAPNNTFTIAANSTIAFRPVADDPLTTTFTLGQENPLTGQLVPNRPNIATTVIPDGNKSNGSLVVTWEGDSSDVQGIILETTAVDGGGGRLLQYGTLLPPGV